MKPWLKNTLGVVAAIVIPGSLVAIGFYGVMKLIDKQKQKNKLLSDTDKSK